jgi:Bacteriophage clamp loader A subunit
MNPFDYVNSILYSKKNLIVDEATEKSYSPFLTNRALSYHKDAILHAQEMNLNGHLDKKLQFDYFINIIRPTKRTNSKWAKKEKDSNIETIQEYFGYNYNKAKIAASILSKEQLKEIKKKLEKGGLDKC